MIRLMLGRGRSPAEAGGTMTPGLNAAEQLSSAAEVSNGDYRGAMIELEQDPGPSHSSEIVAKRNSMQWAEYRTRRLEAQ